ncbi:MAG: recombinase family protein [Tateyamaria sp.]|uniref:recombinase family protein n=1 Tax=Tateyamaria sp. TaxID=1929288 RepID=UPI00329B0E03
MGEMIGYARVSTAGQKLDIQTAALTGAGVDLAHLYKEKASGTKRQGRDALEDMLARGIRKGDTVVVTRLDRLARSSRDLHNIAHKLEDKGVGLKVLEQNIDTTTPAGRLFFTMLGAIAEFETEIRKERQREGINAALAKGKDSPFKGRPPSILRADVEAAIAEQGSKAAAAKALGISRDSVYRVMRLPS